MLYIGLIFIVGGIIYARNGGAALLGAGLVGIGLICSVGWMLWKFVFSIKNRLETKSEWNGLIVDANYQHSEAGTGIAIDTIKKLVHFKHPKQVQSYSFSDIRSWRYNLSTGGQINTYGNVGLTAGLGVAGQNIRNNRENKVASGFFVTVKDIENPEWRAAMSSERDMKKWMEIFEQHVNQN